MCPLRVMWDSCLCFSANSQTTRRHQADWRVWRLSIILLLNCFNRWIKINKVIKVLTICSQLHIFFKFLQWIILTEFSPHKNKPQIYFLPQRPQSMFLPPSPYFYPSHYPRNFFTQNICRELQKRESGYSLLPTYFLIFFNVFLCIVWLCKYTQFRVTHVTHL